MSEGKVPARGPPERWPPTPRLLVVFALAAVAVLALAADGIHVTGLVRCRSGSGRRRGASRNPPPARSVRVLELPVPVTQKDSDRPIALAASWAGPAGRFRHYTARVRAARGWGRRPRPDAATVALRSRAPVARQAHNLEVGGSIPPCAITDGPPLSGAGRRRFRAPRRPRCILPPTPHLHRVDPAVDGHPPGGRRRSRGSGCRRAARTTLTIGAAARPIEAVSRTSRQPCTAGPFPLGQGERAGGVSGTSGDAGEDRSGDGHVVAADRRRSPRGFLRPARCRARDPDRRAPVGGRDSWAACWGTSGSRRARRRGCGPTCWSRSGRPSSSSSPSRPG